MLRCLRGEKEGKNLRFFGSFILSGNAQSTFNFNGSSIIRSHNAAIPRVISNYSYPALHGNEVWPEFDDKQNLEKEAF